MTNNFETMLSGFLGLIKKIKYYNDAVSIMFWDLRTGAPRKGILQRSEAIGTLSAEAFKMSISPEMEEYLNYFEIEENYEKLDKIVKATVKECRREYDRSKKIPEDLYKEYVVLTSESESVWEEAKRNNDFKSFAPYLEKIVDFTLKFLDLWGAGQNKYDTLLDYYEPGMTTEKLDRIFADLRERIVPLVANIKESGYQPDTSFLEKYYEPSRQRELSLFLLDKMHYDFEAGRLDESEHPFTMGITPKDVRVTTHFYSNNLASAIFSSIHEGGHGLYEQNIDEKLIGMPVCTGTSAGMHESQSRLWENMIGRSYNFWKCFYKDLQSAFPHELGEIPLEAFYKAINKVEPSLIRVEADELTYNLHIMIRYEIEKALIDKSIKVEELPQIWNEKMKEYLGIVPPDDTHGVLQDVHWSGGGFGYFPSYTLGNIYAAQLYNAMRKEIPDFDELLCRGEMRRIVDWLREKIHKHGKLMTPDEILKSATGEEINSKYLIEYLEGKYKVIYGLIR